MMPGPTQLLPRPGAVAWPGALLLVRFRLAWRNACPPLGVFRPGRRQVRRQPRRCRTRCPDRCGRRAVAGAGAGAGGRRRHRHRGGRAARTRAAGARRRPVRRDAAASAGPARADGGPGRRPRATRRFGRAGQRAVRRSPARHRRRGGCGGRGGQGAAPRWSAGRRVRRTETRAGRRRHRRGARTARAPAWCPPGHPGRDGRRGGRGRAGAGRHGLGGASALRRVAQHRRRRHRRAAVVVLFLTLRASATEQRPETGWLALRGVPRRHASMYRTAPVVLALAAALPVGLGLGVAAGWLAAAGYARPAHPRLSLAALGLAALATCAGAIAAAAADRQGRAGGVGALMRRVPGRDNAQWVAAGELVAAVCAIAGVVLLRTGADNATGVALLTPALVALATGLIAARALVPVAAAVGRRLLARGRVGHGLALLSLGRRPGVHRAIVLVTVGLAMLGSAVGAWTLAAAARAERADRTLGAARVLTVDARGVSHLLSATRGADPDGRYAMAAVQTYGAPPVLAVDARALPAVARWRPEFGSPTPDEAVHRLRPDYTAPLTGAGSRLRLDLDADRVGDNAFVRVRLAPVDGPTVLARLGPLAPGLASYVTTVDGCATRCRLMALELVSQPADETQVRLHRLDLDDRPLVTPTRFGVAGAWRADLTDVPDETRRFSVHHGPGVEQNYLQIQLSADRRAAFLAVYAADAPVPLPVFRAAGSGVPEQALTLFDAWIPVQVAGTAGQLPRLGGVGLLADLEYVSRLARSPTGAGVLQVWLTGDAPSGVLDRLRAAGVTIVADTGRGALLERYARQGPALALRLYLLAGLLGAGFAAVGLLVVSGVDRGQRAAELAALRRQGLGTATVKAIRAGVYGVPVAVGVLAGILAAVAGTSLTRSILHWFPDQPASALPAVPVDPWPVAVAVGAAIALLAATAAVAAARLGHAVARQGVPAA